jgi:hypothetical protein
MEWPAILALFESNGIAGELFDVGLILVSLIIRLSFVHVILVVF